MTPTGDPAPVPPGPARRDPAAWKAIVLKYQQPSCWRANWQLVNTLGPYALLWYLMYRSLAVSYWLTLGLAIVAGLFLVRIFIERCHKADPLFQEVKPITVFSSLKSLTFRLWDEKLGRLVSFRHLRKARKQRASAEREVESDENYGNPHPKGR